MRSDASVSRLRQRMLEEIQVLTRLSQAAQDRSGMLAGSLYEQRRRCGKRGCRCAKGERHRNLALAVQESRNRQRVSLRDVQKEKVALLIGNYRRFRQARAEMVRVFSGLLKTFDALGGMRQVDVRQLSRSYPNTP